VRTHALPPSTVAALDTWAAQKRQLFVTQEQALPSVLGRIKNQRVAAGECDARLRQKWPEVYTGEGWLVERVTRTLQELPRLTLTFYYVLRWPWRVPIARQAAEIGITSREYWNELRVAEAAVDTGLQLLGAPKSGRPAQFLEESATYA
jgi:hypothetical protein